MAEIIKHSELLISHHYQLSYEHCDENGEVRERGWGFGFPCDAKGNVLPFDEDAAAENYRKCVDGTHRVKFAGVQHFTTRYKEPAQLRCDCGGIVLLEGFTNTCGRCWTDYNMDGQRLSPREQWGEETGEAVADILRIN